jgi:hypothetical protein
MRAAGKKLIGAQASAAIWDGVDEWLRRNPQKSVTDFVLEASMEKLSAEKIPFDRDAALFDGRRRIPEVFVAYKSSSSTAPGVKRLLSKVSASVQKGASK